MDPREIDNDASLSAEDLRKIEEAKAARKAEVVSKVIDMSNSNPYYRLRLKKMSAALRRIDNEHSS